MMLPRENRSTQRKVVPLTLSTLNPTWTGLEPILVLHDEGTVTNHLSHGMGKIM